MAVPRRFNASGTVVTAPAAASPRLARNCPTCGAAPYNRCFRLTSWVVPRIPEVGFFTARQDMIHPARRATPTAEPGVDRTRPELRRQISSLIMRKAGGTERRDIRIWMGSVTRTAEELTAKRDELAARPDLPW